MKTVFAAKKCHIIDIKVRIFCQHFKNGSILLHKKPFFNLKKWHSTRDLDCAASLMRRNGYACASNCTMHLRAKSHDRQEVRRWLKTLPEERRRTGSQVGRFHCREEENACANASLMPVTNHEVQNVHAWTKPVKKPTITPSSDNEWVHATRSLMQVYRPGQA